MQNISAVIRSDVGPTKKKKKNSAAKKQGLPKAIPAIELQPLFPLVLIAADYAAKTLVTKAAETRNCLVSPI